jgi:hypothetical protein
MLVKKKKKQGKEVNGRHFDTLPHGFPLTRILRLPNLGMDSRAVL